jgi:hypothetical protein
MRTLKQKLIAKIFNNPFGRLYFGVPEGKEIYKITRSSAHYYTGEFSKINGLPIICTGDTKPNGRNPFIYLLETWKPIHLCWFYIKMGWKIPKYFIGLDTGAKAATATGGSYNSWNNPTNAYTEDGTNFATAGDFQSREQSYETFGFEIPAGATINGIEFYVKGKNSAGTATIRLALASGVLNKTKTQAFSTTNTGYTLGSSSDLWGGAFTDTHFSDANFHATIYGNADEAGNTRSVDFLSIKVYYTEVSNLANLKTYNTNLKANIKSINTNLIANVKSLNTNT